MKRSVKVLIALFLLAAAMFFGKKFIDTDYFKVQDVFIDGVPKLLKQDIVTPLEQMKGKNIVYLNTNEIENIIKSDIRVKKVSIKKLFPSKIEVVLEEREPYVYVKKGNETLLADKELNIYGNILEDPSKNIPVIDYKDDESLNGIKMILSKIKNKDNNKFCNKAYLLYPINNNIRRYKKVYHSFRHLLYPINNNEKLPLENDIIFSGENELKVRACFVDLSSEEATNGSLENILETINNLNK